MKSTFVHLSFIILSLVAGSSFAEWSYIVNPAKGKDSETKCINPSGDLVGGWRSCHIDGTCNNAAAIRERCQLRHGTPTGEWSYVVNPTNDSLTKCINPSGDFVGDWRSCYADGTCNNAAAIKDKCRTNAGSSSQGSHAAPSLRTSTVGSAIFFYVTNHEDISYTCTVTYSYSWDDFGTRKSRSDQSTANVPAKYSGQILRVNQNAPNVALDSSNMSCN